MKRIKRDKPIKKEQVKPIEISLNTGYTKRPEPSKTEAISKTAGSLFARGAEFFSSLKAKQPEKSVTKKENSPAPAAPAAPKPQATKESVESDNTSVETKQSPSREKIIPTDKPAPVLKNEAPAPKDKITDPAEKTEPKKEEAEAAKPAVEAATQSPQVTIPEIQAPPAEPESTAPKPETENKLPDEKIEEKKPGIEKITTPYKQNFTGSAIMEIDSICKSFVIGDQTVQILKNISFKISEGDFMVVFGPSGCGKSTLLHTILGLEPPTSGKINFMDNNLYENTDEDDRAIVRKQHVGMIYQQPNWIKSLTVIENVTFPLTLLGAEKIAAQEKGMAVLKQVQMENWANYHPAELSSGQQQRIAMARALVNNPMLIVADEPTGNLDYDSGQLVMQLFSDLNEQQKKTIVMVTHDLEYLKYSKTAVRMLDGQVVGIYDKKEQEKLFEDLQFKRGFLNSADTKKQ